MRSCLIIVLIILFLTPSLCLASRGISLKITKPDGVTEQIPLYKESHALLIGVSDYTDGWPDLESIPGEMDSLEKSLKEQGFNVVKVLNPDSRKLADSFENFVDRYGYDEENRLLFFFSGHGYSRKEGKKGYLVPADAPDPTLNEKGFLRKAVNMSKILTWARQIESKHAMFIFDSCFSGTVFKSRALPKTPPHISSIVTRPVRQFISSGSAGEEVPARSVFVPSFIKALRGEGDLDNDGYVTGTELGMFLHRKVTSYGTGQTPQYGKIRDPDLDEGDFILTTGSIENKGPDENEINADQLLDVNVSSDVVEFVGNGSLRDYDFNYNKETSSLTLKLNNISYKKARKIHGQSKQLDSLFLKDDEGNLIATFKFSSRFFSRFDVVQNGRKLAVKLNGVWPSNEYKKQNKDLIIKKIKHETARTSFGINGKETVSQRVFIDFSSQVDLSILGFVYDKFSFVVKNASFSDETESYRYDKHISIIPNGSKEDVKFTFDFKREGILGFAYSKNKIAISYYSGG